MDGWKQNYYYWLGEKKNKKNLRLKKKKQKTKNIKHSNKYTYMVINPKQKII